MGSGACGRQPWRRRTTADLLRHSAGAAAAPCRPCSGVTCLRRWTHSAAACPSWVPLPHAEPAMFRALWPLVLAAAGDSRASAVLAGRWRTTVTVARFNRGAPGYAEAILAGRRGDRDRAAELASTAGSDIGAGTFGHLARVFAADRRGATAGKPARWLESAHADFTAKGFGALAAQSRALLQAPAPDRLARLGVTPVRPTSSCSWPRACPTRRSRPGCSCLPEPWKSTWRACSARPALGRAPSWWRSPAPFPPPGPARGTSRNPRQVTYSSRCAGPAAAARCRYQHQQERATTERVRRRRTHVT